VSAVADRLEGAARPGHFDGVATVVTKLLWAVEPDRAYFGQKDAQQLAVVRRLAADLDTGVEIVACPIVREADGLAVSSRNVYLNPDERAQAASLSRALQAAAGAYRSGEHDPVALRTLMRNVIEAEPLARIDYAEVVDPGNFSSPGSLAVLAVRFGSTRLIDNHDLADPYPG
jgi:pantoate--beta-alanine ligase